MGETVKEVMKGKKEKTPLMNSIGSVLKSTAKKPNVKSVKVKIKMQ